MCQVRKRVHAVLVRDCSRAYIVSFIYVTNGHLLHCFVCVRIRLKVRHLKGIKAG
jgi:hypothetical protein